MNASSNFSRRWAAASWARSPGRWICRSAELRSIRPSFIRTLAGTGSGRSFGSVSRIGRIEFRIRLEPTLPVAG